MGLGMVSEGGFVAASRVDGFEISAAGEVKADELGILLTGCWLVFAGTEDLIVGLACPERKQTRWVVQESIKHSPLTFHKEKQTKETAIVPT